MAEGLRIQFYWQWAGVKANWCDSYPKRHEDDLKWHHFALDTWKPSVVDEKSNSKEVLQYWIDNQLDYFKGKDRKSGSIKKNHDKNHQTHFHARWPISVGLIWLGIVAFLMIWIDYIFHPGLWLTVTKYAVLFLIGVGLLYAAMRYALGERHAFAEHESAFRKMAAMYVHAEHQLKQSDSNVDKIITELGKEAIDESIDWLLLHRIRKADEARI